MYTDNLESDVKFFRAENEKKPTEMPVGKIAEYAAGKRLMPAGTPFPGFWDNERTPYSQEIMENMSPLSFVQHTVVMKPTQVGLTALAENCVCYWMDECPAPILFVSATQGLLDKWSKRIEPAIDSCGFREKIYSQFETKGSRRTGDKTFCKEYVGGALDMASAQSAPSLRSDSKRILIRDEIDGCPPLLRYGEGYWLDVSYARTDGWGHRKKVLDFSTPTTYDDSQVWQLYKQGDQRKFFVPCPYCGEFQELVWTGEEVDHGLKWDLVDNRLDEESVRYLCKFCHEPIKNNQKSLMLPEGKWRPTAKSKSKTYRSYHLNSLYSPVGMFSWAAFVEAYLDAQSKPDGMRSFTNLRLGMPYREAGARPDLKKLIALRGVYRQGTVPDGVLFLTGAADIQRGSATNPNNPARIELEICGHGKGYRTWSIDYMTFQGDVLNPLEGAWELMRAHGEKTGFAYFRDDGREFRPVLMFIDSGDGNVTAIVYSWCENKISIYPIKGFGYVSKKKKDKDGDQASAYNYMKYRARTIGLSKPIYEISTNHYKDIIYTNLNIQRKDNDPQRSGFCDFPLDYGEKYFQMLRAEEKRLSDGSYHAGQRRNEALDCRVYNLCASDVFLNARVLKIREEYKKQGMSDVQLAQINSRVVLDDLERKTARRIEDGEAA